jgi:hypothetical protein
MTTISDDFRRELGQFYDWLLVHAYGRAHAKTAKAIAEATNWSDRDLRAFASAAVDEGYLICADGAGYFVPSQGQEVAATVRRLRSQAAEMGARATRLEALAASRFDRQGRRPTLLDAAGF